MVSSNTEIANMALRHLGQSTEIADLSTDQTEAAFASRAFFETARDATLRDFPWPFAATTADLTQVAPEPTIEWGYSYVYPPDCLQAHRIVTGNRRETQADRIPFRLQYGAASILILTDQVADDATLEYTRRETDPLRFPPDFALALSFRLAYYMAASMTAGDPFKLQERCLRGYSLEIAQAQSRAGNEEQPDLPPEASAIAAR